MQYPSMYDDMIVKKTKPLCREFGFDWRIAKAQLIAESSLDPEAVSPVGAKGLAQFMPSTWVDAISSGAVKVSASPFDPEYAIKAYLWYMSKMLHFWSWPRPNWDRISLALASYNAGSGNILKAQKAAENNTLYNPIIEKLHYVTGDYAEETSGYVKRVWRLAAKLMTNDLSD